MRSIVVVGAGLPGIAASLALSKKGDQVILLDLDSSIGGLLRSYEADRGIYDYGTHFANRTGVEELDELLFGGYESEWLEFPKLRSGNFWKGQLNNCSDNPNLNFLERELHDKCLSDILRSSGWGREEEPENAREFLEAEYGSTLVELFFDPVLTKLLGVSSDQLYHKAHELFNLRRFAVLDPSATAELKASPRYDSKFSYHHRDDYHQDRVCLYPRDGGIGRWITQLESKLVDSGVRILTGTSVKNIVSNGTEVKSITLDGEVIDVDHLIWGVGAFPFLMAAGVEAIGIRPSSRMTILAGLEFDRPFLSDLHYLTVFDESLRSFRVTIYPNFRNDGRHLSTVEFMLDPADRSRRDWIQLAIDEMTQMGVISADARAISSHIREIPAGFPVLTNEVIHSQNRHIAEVGKFDNVTLVGRASGGGWFLDDLIRGAYDRAVSLV